MVEQIRALSAVWIEPCVNPNRITAYTDYDMNEFRAFCEKTACKLIIIAADAHHQNGTIEAGNRTLRMFVRYIQISEKQLDLA
jgi:hypothetical protein